MRDDQALAFQDEEPPSAPTQAVSPRQFADRLIAAALRSRNPTRDAALVCVLLGTGLSPMEIAALTIADFLTEDGTVRTCSFVRGEGARKASARPLFWSCPSVTAAVMAYLIERGLLFGLVNSQQPYLGFDPDERLFLTGDGHPIRIHQKRAVGRSVCVGIHTRFQSLLRAAGLAQYTTFHARKLFAVRLYTHGASFGEICTLLGVARQGRIRKMIEEIVDSNVAQARLLHLTASVLPPLQNDS